MNLREVKAGMILLFTEDDGQFIVRVDAASETDTTLEFALTVREVVRQSRIYKPIPVGKVMAVSVSKDYLDTFVPGMWRLNRI